MKDKIEILTIVIQMNTLFAEMVIAKEVEDKMIIANKWKYLTNKLIDKLDL